MKDIENMHTKGLPPGSIGRLKEVKIRFFLMHNAVHNAICHLYPQCYFHLLLITVGLCFFKTSTNGRILARVTHLYVCLWMKAIPQYWSKHLNGKGTVRAGSLMTNLFWCFGTGKHSLPHVTATHERWRLPCWVEVWGLFENRIKIYIFTEDFPWDLSY